MLDVSLIKKNALKHLEIQLCSIIEHWIWNELIAIFPCYKVKNITHICTYAHRHTRTRAQALTHTHIHTHTHTHTEAHNHMFAPL